MFRCNRRTRLYTCPRCGVGYCSTECYKSDAHTDCSESFYKQCVEEELKSQENDPAARQKMIEILKRVHEADLEDDALGEDINEEDSPLDSDDEQEVNKILYFKKVISFIYSVYNIYKNDIYIYIYNFYSFLI